MGIRFKGRSRKRSNTRHRQIFKGGALSGSRSAVVGVSISAQGEFVCLDTEFYGRQRAWSGINTVNYVYPGGSSFCHDFSLSLL
jgi:hypothetical protein